MTLANKHPSLGRLYIDSFSRNSIPKNFDSIEAVRKTIQSIEKDPELLAAEFDNIYEILENF